MRFSTITAASILALAHKSLGSGYFIQNYCEEDVWVTLTNSAQESTQFVLSNLETYGVAMEGSGNSVGLTKSSDYWSGNTPKFIFGYTVTSSSPYNQIWWSVNNVNGDPFVGEQWNISGCGSAGAITTYGTNAYECADNQVTIDIYTCAT